MGELTKVKFTGQGVTSFFGQVKCVYFEHAIFFEKNWSTSTNHYHSNEQFNTKVNGEEIEISIPPARVYMKPTLEQEYDTAKAPAKIKQVLKNVFSTREIPKKVLIREWCILPGKEYFMRVISESYYLPPEPGSDSPTDASSTTYEIYDKEYPREEKGKYQTPASSWTH